MPPARHRTPEAVVEERTAASASKLSALPRLLDSPEALTIPPEPGGGTRVGEDDTGTTKHRRGEYKKQKQSVGAFICCHVVNLRMIYTTSFHGSFL